MSDTLDRIIVNGVEQAVEAGAAMTEPWKSERDRRVKTEENRQKLQPVDPPFPIPEGGGGGGGSGVLVAHATVDDADLETLDPDNPLAITIDKTYMELLEAEYSVIHIDVTYDGGTALSLDFPRMAWAEGLIYEGSELLGLLMDYPYNLVISVALSDGDTVAKLMALPASSGGGDEPFVLHGTITSQSPISGTVTETRTALAEALNSGKRIVFEVEIDGQTTQIEMTTKFLSNSYGDVFVGGFFRFEVSNTMTLAFGSVSNPVSEQDTLTFSVTLYTLTPFSGS